MFPVSPPSLETRNEPDTSEAMVGELYHLFSLLLSYSLNAPHVSFLVNNLTLINIDHLHLWSIYECWNPAATVLKMFKLSQYLFHLDHPRDYLICWSKSGQNTMERWPPNPFVVMTKPPPWFHPTSVSAIFARVLFKFCPQGSLRGPLPSRGHKTHF